MSKKRSGGPRPGAGRKPLEDPKVSIFLWIEQSAVDRVGGEKEAKALAENAIRRAKNKSEKVLVKSK